MNASGSPLATLFSNLWLCDAAGDVYVLKNLDKYIDSSAAYQQYKSYLATCHAEGLPAPPTSPNVPSLEWIKVGSKFSSIAAGFEGLVCGLKDARLYIRVGLCVGVPEGTGWVEVIGKAAQIAVGKDCIARKTDSGKLFISNVRQDYSCCSVSTQPLVLSWHAISVGGLEEMLSQQNTTVTSETLEHFLLDENDRLFIVTDTGWVYACFQPCAEDSVTSWIKVSEPPQVQRSFFHNLYYPFCRPKKEGFFRQVCAGRGLLWCVRPDNLDLRQLVMSDFTTSEGVCELRTNWSKVTLPTDDERPVLLAASKNTVDGIYAMMKKNYNGHTQIVAFSLNQAGHGRVEIPLPSQYDPQVLEIALCSCGPVSMTMSKLSRIDKNECCENGDCEFCQNAQTLIIPPSSRFTYPLTSGMKGKGELGVSSMLGKRPHPDSQLPEAAAIGNGSDSELLHESKRRRVEHPKLERFGLLERIDVKFNFIDHLADVRLSIFMFMYNISTHFISFRAVSRPINLTRSTKRL